MNLTYFRQNIFNWPVAIILAASFLLVYIIPVAWIHSVPGMDAYLTWLPIVVPGIQSSIQASHFREIATVYYPIIFLFSPLACIEVWLMEKKPERWITNFYATPLKNTFLTFFCLIFTFGGFWCQTAWNIYHRTASNNEQLITSY